MTCPECECGELIETVFDNGIFDGNYFIHYECEECGQVYAKRRPAKEA